MSQHPKSIAEIPGLQLKQLNDPRVIEKLKVMDKYLFPVNYTDKYYTSLAAGLHKFHALAYFNDMLVGSCTCRREKVENARDAGRVGLKWDRAHTKGKFAWELIVENVRDDRTDDRLSHCQHKIRVILHLDCFRSVRVCSCCSIVHVVRRWAAWVWHHQEEILQVGERHGDTP